MECLIFGTLFGQVWTKFAQCLAYYYSYKFSKAICQSFGFLTYLLKFYSGGAVDLWSCYLSKPCDACIVGNAMLKFVRKESVSKLYSNHCHLISLYFKLHAVTLFISVLYHFPTSSLMINLKQSKKINRLLGEPELPSQPFSLALTFLLSRAKLKRERISELQTPKIGTVRNVNKTDNRKDDVDNSKKKTDIHFKKG